MQDVGSRAARSLPSVNEPILRRVLYFATMLLATLMALGLVGLDVAWLLNGVIGLAVIVVGSLGVALAVGSIGTVQDLLAIRHLRRRLGNGQSVTAGNVSGRVVEFTDTSLVLETETGVVHLPGRYLASRPVHVAADE